MDEWWTAGMWPWREFGKGDRGGQGEVQAGDCDCKGVADEGRVVEGRLEGPLDELVRPSTAPVLSCCICLVERSFWGQRALRCKDFAEISSDTRNNGLSFQASFSFSTPNFAALSRPPTTAPPSFTRLALASSNAFSLVERRSLCCEMVF